MQPVYDVVIIGAGQAGLAAAYEAQQKGLKFTVLDAQTRVGASWRQRYDSLVLFTPAEYDGLPGMPLELAPDALPTKDQIADYLEGYAAHFRFPLRLGEGVRSLRRTGEHFAVESTRGRYLSHNVIVASGPFHKPVVPSYPGRESASIVQLHSSTYKNPAQLPVGPVLVVGAGNSAAQIADELSQDRPVVMSVREPMQFRALKKLGKSVFFWANLLGLMHADKESLRGRRMRRRGDPIFGLSLRDRVAVGAVSVAPEIASFDGGVVTFSDGSVQRFASIVWATGFRGSYDWLQVEGALDADGQPLHQRGVSPVPGLGFVGLPWLRSRSSALLMGAGRDAKWVVSKLWPRAHEAKRSSRVSVTATPLRTATPESLG